MELERTYSVLISRINYTIEVTGMKISKEDTHYLEIAQRDVENAIDNVENVKNSSVVRRKMFNVLEDLQDMSRDFPVKTVVDDLEAVRTLMFCALRYVLPRQSYMTGTVADIIIKHKDIVSLQDRNIMLRDIRERLASVKSKDDTIDRTVWKNLYNVLKGNKDTRYGSTSKI